MSIRLTEDQILQLAPDASSVKAGLGQAKESKWPLLRCGDRAVWGHCQGSGSSPYQTIIDLTDIAFKCSCPSHKFPCKHALGLLLLYARSEGAFTREDEPEWVTSWLEKRAESAEKKAEREAKKKEQGEKPKDPKEAEKRLAARHKKILAGIDELELWMKDLLRAGLMHVPERGTGAFRDMARRMIDAQAPGIAQRLYELSEIDYDGEGWQTLLMERLARLYLLLSAYRRVDTLSEEWQTELRTMVGFTQSREEVLQGEAVEDRWYVLCREVSETMDMRTEIYHLLGEQSHRHAVYLSFIVPGRLPEMTLMEGMIYQAKLYFYRGVSPRRALIQGEAISEGSFSLYVLDTLEEAMAHYREELTRNPFVQHVPLCLGSVRLAPEGKGMMLYDATGRRQEVELGREELLSLLTQTGGEPCAAFVIISEGRWRLISVWYKEDYILLYDEHNR